MAESNKYLCWTEILTVALSLGKEEGKLARIIPFSKLKFRENLAQGDLCLVILHGFFPMNLCNCLYSAK